MVFAENRFAILLERGISAKYVVQSNLAIRNGLIRNQQPRMPRIGPCQVLAATLTLSQPGGADYAHPILGSLAG